MCINIIGGPFINQGKKTLFIHGLQFKAVGLWGRVGEMLVLGLEH